MRAEEFMKLQCKGNSFLMLVISLIFGLTTKAQNTEVPQFPEWMIVKRIEQINQQTPIQLDYNEFVQAYIDVYTVKRRDHLANIISRSKLYFPLFEEYLDKYNLPLELKYLAVIESALDPRAKSSSGAAGLWQFLYHSGTMFDLEVTTYSDERCDPLLSTDAACRYLEYLYRNLNDWQLALAAYNGGIGEVKKAMERSGKTNYWELRPYLPEQVKGYVPAFIAACYVMQYAKNYDIPDIKNIFLFSDIDTLHVNERLTFNDIINRTGINEEDLEWLNPMYTKRVIPQNGKSNYLYLPKEYVSLFISNSASTNQKPTDNELYNKKKISYTVSKGEYFHKIAIKHGCTIEDIMKWNHLKSKDLHPGQILTIWVDDKEKYFFVLDESAG